MGTLHCLWWWALDYAKDGDLSSHDHEDIAIACEWEGDQEHLIAVLVECRFLDEADGLSIHDWDEYVGRFMEAEEKRQAKNTEMRRAYANGTIASVRERDGDRCRYCGKVVVWTDKRGPDGATYDHVDPRGPSTFENLVIACRSCNSSKGAKPLSKSGLTLNQVGFKSVLAADLPDKKEKKEKKENAGARATEVGRSRTRVQDSEPRPISEIVSGRLKEAAEKSAAHLAGGAA